MDRRFAAQAWNCRKRSCSEARRTWRKLKGSVIRELRLEALHRRDPLVRGDLSNLQIRPSDEPTVELVLQRVDPDDAAFVKQTIERASQDGKDFDMNVA